MNDAIREDEGLDLDRFLEPALESVVETIINFGEFPPPKSGFSSKANRTFDLYEFLQDEKFVEHSDLLEFFICALGDYSNCGAFSDLRARWDKRLTEHLLDNLKGSEIVRAEAEKYADEE